MKVSLVTTPNIFEPHHREFGAQDVQEGSRADALLPPSVDPVCCFVWVNGELVENPAKRELREGDFVQVAVTPGLFGGEIPLLLNILLSAALLVGPSLLIQYLSGELKEPVEDPNGSANNGFAGFRNSYESGAVAPVVYGRHRVAAPAVNQEIGAAGGTTLLTQTEVLRVLYAISEGPIYGIGRLLGVAGTEAEAAAVLADAGGGLVEGLDLQINGQVAENFAGVTANWRTGEDTQERIPGYTATTQTAVIEQALNEITGIGAGPFPAGVYTSGTDIEAPSPGDAVTYQTADEYDRVRIQFLFGGGLYTASGGTPTSSEAKFRVQYYATDAVGTRIDDTVLLPEITVTGNLQTAAVYDLEIPLLAASGYTGPAQLGYYATNTIGIQTDWIRCLAPLNEAVLPDGYGSADQLAFSVSAWVRATQVGGSSGVNIPIFHHFTGSDTKGYSGSFPYELDVNSTDAGFSFRIEWNGSACCLVLESSAEGTSGLCRWRSSFFGNTTSFAFWAHVGFSYQDPLFGLPPIVRFYYNGVELATVQSSFNSAWRGYFSTSANLYWGFGQCETASNDTEEQHQLDICSAGLYNRQQPAEFFEAQFSSTNDTYGFKDGAVLAGAEDLRAGFNVISLVDTDKLHNLASGFESSTTDGEVFEVTDITEIVPSPSTATPIYTKESGVPIKSYYAIEVFRSNPVFDDPTVEQNEASVEQLTLYLDTELEHPQTALLDVRVVADDQVNNARPTITSLVYGRLCPVWDGVSTEFPSYVNTWTRNPAWIALDMLSNTRYGMGNIFPLETAFDLPTWGAWAAFCDEGVEDGFEAQTFYGGEITQFPGPTSTFGRVRFKIPLLISPTNPTGNSIPDVWVVGKTLGIKAADSATQASLAGGWVTTEQNGLLEITQILYKEDVLAPDGYTFWAEIDCEWASTLPLPTTSNGDVTGTVVGFEQRCMFDGVFDEKNASSWDQVISVFQAGRAMPILVGSKLSVFIDRLRPPVGMVTMANCIEGSFELDWVDSGDLANSLDVDFLDELANYERVTIQVDHDSVQDEASFEGLVKESVRMVGVTRRSQAVRDATYRLNQRNDLKRRAKFQLGLDGIPLIPGDRIQVSHDTPNYGMSGRLLGSGEGSGGNLNPYPDGFADNLLQFGGMLDVSDAVLEIAGVPTFASASPGFQITGPLGFGTAELLRNTVIGNGEDDPSTGDAATAGVATALQFFDGGLLPPSAAPSFVGTVNDTAWEVTVAAFFKEPDIAASDTVALAIAFPVNASGSPLNEEFRAYFKWTAGVLAVDGTPSNNATATVQAPGTTGASAGWYRAAIHMRYSDLPGGSSIAVGDPYQALVFPATEGSMAAGEFRPAAVGGKGVNFIPNGDPLSLFAGWTATNVTATSLTVAEPPPFYDDVDHGSVWQATTTFTTTDGTTAFWRHIATIDGFNTSFGGDGVVASQDFTVTLFIKNLNATATRVAVENTVSGQYCRATITWAGPTVSFATTNGGDAQLNAVTQNSTTTDADWYQFDVTFRNAGGDQQYNVDIYPEYAVSGAASKGVYVWGIRSHGVSSTGTRVNPYPHRGAFVWGVEVLPSYILADYNSGGSVALDRDMTFQSGKSYEIEVRSSTAQAPNGGPVVERVPIDPAEVPGSVPAGTFIATSSGFKSFTADRGDIDSIGESGTTSVDFAVVSIDLDPETLVRDVVAVEYKDEVYEDPDDLPGVNTALTTFVSTPAPTSGGGGGVPVTALYGKPPEVEETTSITSDGEVEYSVNATWSMRTYEENTTVGGVRLYVAEKASASDPEPLAPSLVADVSRKVRSFAIKDFPWNPGTSYRIYFQPYSSVGNAKPIKQCAFAELTFYGGAPRPASSARVVSKGARGERALITVRRQDSDNPMEPTTFEARVGGWRLGQRLTNILANEGDMTDELLTGPTNAAGEGAPPILIRGRLGRGCLGRPVETRMDTTALTGQTILADVPVEDDWFDGGGATLTNFSIGTDGLGLTSTGTPGIWESATRDFGYPRRVYAEAWAEADLIPSATIDDLSGPPILSSRLNHWTFEGPLSGPEFDGTELTIEWDHDDGVRALGTNYERFRPGVVFMRRCKFRVSVTQDKDPDIQCLIKRIGIRIIEMPSYRADGGVF